MNSLATMGVERECRVSVIPSNVKVLEIGITESKTLTVDRPADQSLESLCCVENRMASDLEGLTDRPLWLNHMQRDDRQFSIF